MSVDPERIERAANVVRRALGADTEVTYPQPEHHEHVVLTIQWSSTADAIGSNAAKGACALRLSWELFEDNDDGEIERWLQEASGRLCPGDSLILTSDGTLGPYPP